MTAATPLELTISPSGPGPEARPRGLYHLDQLVLVGVRSGLLLDAAGEKEVSVVVFEARG
jgi:hypothetical protein